MLFIINKTLSLNSIVSHWFSVLKPTKGKSTGLERMLYYCMWLWSVVKKLRNKECVHIQIIHDFNLVLLMFYAMNVKVGPYSIKRQCLSTIWPSTGLNIVCVHLSIFYLIYQFLPVIYGNTGNLPPFLFYR